MIKDNEKIQKTFSEIYSAEELLAQITRYEKLTVGFQQHFGNGGGLSYYSAPGRVEIGGNHTDHQRGKVIAVSVNVDIIGVVRQNENQVRLKSEGYDNEIIVDVNNLGYLEEEKGTSEALVKGVLKYLENMGWMIGGFEGCLSSNVLTGSGISSSAAFESLIGEIISCEYNGGKIGPVDIAKAGQYAENVYFGKMSGLMDQMGSAVGGFIYIDFKDRENPDYKSIPFNIGDFGYAMCVVNTGGSHAGLADEYSQIPKEMRVVASHFGKEDLTGVDAAGFYDCIPEIRKNVGDRAVLRAMHFFGDTERVARQKYYLETGDINNFLHAVKESGRSSFCYLQNVYSLGDFKEQGVSLGLALTERFLGGSGAWRVHGGGFAGTILVFLPIDRVDGYRAEIEKVFGENSCMKLHVRPYGVCKLN